MKKTFARAFFKGIATVLKTLNHLNYILNIASLQRLVELEKYKLFLVLFPPKSIKSLSRVFQIKS